MITAMTIGAFLVTGTVIGVASARSLAIRDHERRLLWNGMALFFLALGLWNSVQLALNLSRRRD